MSDKRYITQFIESIGNHIALQNQSYNNVIKLAKGLQPDRDIDPSVIQNLYNECAFHSDKSLKQTRILENILIKEIKRK